MGLFDGLFGKKQEPEHRAAPEQCHHASLAPRWDSVDDMGKTERITSYLCAGCGREFSRHEGDQLRYEAQQALERTMAGTRH